ncbi:MAG: hypothetical protein M3R59_11180, partial [Verrucomicrobiota bacterium]|nr:hypothetical protein [Verrucomicrobiota bacterium]
RRLAGTPAGAKVTQLIDGLTLERAANIPDEIKRWDKKGPDDPRAFKLPDHPEITRQLHDFWRANEPTHEDGGNPSHHWMHYTDVPVAGNEKYADGKVGRGNWDIVHAIPYCIGVLDGTIPADNPRKITKPVAVILLAHFLGDIHQPLHVGAEYFNAAGASVNPDQDHDALADQGGNTLALLERATPTHPPHFYHSLHGFWDSDAVRQLVIGTPDEVKKEMREATYAAPTKKIIDEYSTTEPANWKTPGAPKTWAEQWANEIMPLAREAHTRLHFDHMNPQEKDGAKSAKGDAVEIDTGYRDFAAKVVGMELHKAGWRLAAVLEAALSGTKVESRPATASTTAVAPAPAKTEAAVAAATPPPPPALPFGNYPADYKAIVTTWVHAAAPESSTIDFQGEPKPAELPGGGGQHLRGYLVIFNSGVTGRTAKTHSLLIRDGKVISSSGFDQ